METVHDIRNAFFLAAGARKCIFLTNRSAMARRCAPIMNMQSDTQKADSSATLRCGEWFASVPPTEPGQCIEYIVTVESRNGKRFVQLAQHANTHWLPWDDSYDGDDIDEEGGKVWSGWLDVRQDRYGDDLLMEVKGTVVAWMPKPAAYLANQRRAIPPEKRKTQMNTSKYIIVNDGRGVYVAEIATDSSRNISSVTDTADRAQALPYDSEASALFDADALRAAGYAVRVEAR